MATWSFSTAPFDSEDAREHRQKIAHVLNLAMSGKLNCTGEVTLTANDISTTVTDARVSGYSTIVFDPLTANAAAELAAGTMYVAEADRLGGSFTITHTNAASTVR